MTQDGIINIGDTIAWDGVNRTERGVVTEICYIVKMADGKSVVVSPKSVKGYMTEKDMKLIARAEDIRWEDAIAEELEEKADTDEAKNRIHAIIMRKYHRDEYDCDML